MAITYVGGKTHAFAGTTSNVTIALTGLTGGSDSAPSAGDIVIVAYVTPSAADRSMPVLTAGYTEIADLYADDFYNTNLSVCYKVQGPTPDTSVQVPNTVTGTYAGAVAIHVWRGVDSSSPLDVATTTATGIDTGRPDPPAITPTSPGAVIVVCGGAAEGSGLAFAQPGTQLSNFLSVNSPDSEDAMVGVGSFQWTSGTFNPVAWVGGDTATNASWVAATLALRPGGVGGASDVNGTGTGSISFTGSSAATTPRNASASGAVALAGSATGTAPSSGINGSASGSLDFIGSVAGTVTGAGTASSLEYRSVAVDAANVSTYTFTDMDFGAADAARYIIAAIAWRSAGTANDIDTVTIGGVTATLIQEARNTGGGNLSACDLYIAPVPSGTSGDVVISTTTAAVRLGVAVYRLVGVASAMPDHTDVGQLGTINNVASITTTVDSHVIGIAFNGNGSCVLSSAHDDVPAGTLNVETTNGATTTDWSGLTEDADLFIENTNGTYGALIIAAWEKQAGASGAAGVATGSIDLTGTVAAISPRNATVDGAIDFTGAAFAGLRITSAASGSIGLSGTAASVAKVQGAATGSIALTGASTATNKITATGTGSFPIAGAAAATVALKATGAGSLAFTGAAGGSAKAQGTSAGTITFAGSASATVLNSGTASGNIALLGSASGSGVLTSTATGAGEIGFTGAAAATVKVQGSAAGAVSLTGASVASNPAKGAASGQIALSGAAAATAKVSGAAAGSIALTGDAAASVATAATDGTVAGSIDLAGSAAGKISIGGEAAGALPIAGNGAGKVWAQGEGSGAIEFTGAADAVSYRLRVPTTTRPGLQVRPGRPLETSFSKRPAQVNSTRPTQTTSTRPAAVSRGRR